MSQAQNITPLIAHTAEQALARAEAAAPRPEAAPGMHLALPAAAVLLGRAVDARWARALQQLAEHLGQYDRAHAAEPLRAGDMHRPVYEPLAVHLFLRCYARARDRSQGPLDDAAMRAQLTRLAGPICRTVIEGAERSLPLTLWHALCALQAHAMGLIADDAPPLARSANDQIASALTATPPRQGGEPLPLHPLGPDEPLDFWTFDELSALHALHRLVKSHAEPAWATRLHAALDYHQQHTQPDYTTYQPWALAAFAERPGTRLFAEQQLHDATTHLHLASPAGGLMIALLLADAAQS